MVSNVDMNAIAHNNNANNLMFSYINFKASYRTNLVCFFFVLTCYLHIFSSNVIDCLCVFCFLFPFFFRVLVDLFCFAPFAFALLILLLISGLDVFAFAHFALLLLLSRLGVCFDFWFEFCLFLVLLYSFSC